MEYNKPEIKENNKKYGKCGWKKKQKEEELMKEVEKLGIKPQVDSLKQKGFEKVKKVVKALIRNDMDYEKTLAYLENKKSKKINMSEIREKLQNLKLDSAVEKVHSTYPHMRLKKIAKILAENQNDPEKANQSIEQHFAKKKEKKYKKLFPDDKSFDWNKFKDAKLEKKKEKYSKLFPGETEYDWEKFKAAKKQKREEKAQKILFAENNQVKEICPGIKTIYLDGNNMLFVDNTLRSLCLKNKIKSACEKLAKLSGSYSLNVLKINTKLIFDREKQEYDQESEGVKFMVRSANPSYETSDDALVDWAGGLSASDLADSLFVTSDRGLQIRLLQKGNTKLMKSKFWLQSLKQGLGEDKFNQILNDEN
jgi:hypothetical protein